MKLKNQKRKLKIKKKASNKQKKFKNKSKKTLIQLEIKTPQKLQPKEQSEEKWSKLCQIKNQLGLK